MFIRIVDGSFEEGTLQEVLPGAARRLVEPDIGAWVMFVENTPVADVEATGWFAITDVPRPTVEANQRIDGPDLRVTNGRPEMYWTVRTETAAEATERTRQGNRATLQNPTTVTSRITDLREFLSDPDVATFTARANNTPWDAVDRRAMKTALRTVDRLIKIVERLARADIGGALLDDISNT